MLLKTVVQWHVQFRDGYIDERNPYADRNTAAWIAKVNPANGYRVVKATTIFELDEKITANPEN